jgi:hypothetical protein
MRSPADAEPDMKMCKRAVRMLEDKMGIDVCGARKAKEWYDVMYHALAFFVAQATLIQIPAQRQEVTCLIITNGIITVIYNGAGGRQYARVVRSKARIRRLDGVHE